jgi:hypothetical protein
MGALFALPRPVEELPLVWRSRFYEIYMRQAPEYARIYMRLIVFGPVFTWQAHLPAKQQKDHPMPVFLLDLIYVAIGAAAFAITALYLGACDSL